MAMLQTEYMVLAVRSMSSIPTMSMSHALQDFYTLERTATSVVSSAEIYWMNVTPVSADTDQSL